jgi:hypothetical protein
MDLLKIGEFGTNGQVGFSEKYLDQCCYRFRGLEKMGKDILPFGSI